jgi:hypothetical protein
MTSSVERQAACSCGQLRLRLAGDPQLVSSCHCLACQRRTGALFGSTSYFRRDQILSIQGERRTFGRQADSGNRLTFQFCPNCGSTVFWESERQPDLVSVAVGAFADPDFPAPVRTVWAKTRHDWLAFPKDIPVHPESPP